MIFFFIQPFIIFAGILLVSGCDSLPYLGTAEKPPLPGKRISILVQEQTLEADFDYYRKKNPLTRANL